VLERPDELGGERDRAAAGPAWNAGRRRRLACRPRRRAARPSRRARRGDRDRHLVSRTFTVDNPSTRYRWLLAGGNVDHAWVNGLDLIPYDVADADDFVLTTDPGGPEWHLGSVVYEIFPDRFALDRSEVCSGPAAGVGVAAGRRAPRGAPPLLLGHAGRGPAVRRAGAPRSRRPPTTRRSSRRSVSSRRCSLGSRR
jgi:hypothetical protein